MTRVVVARIVKATMPIFAAEVAAVVSPVFGTVMVGSVLVFGSGLAELGVGSISGVGLVPGVVGVAGVVGVVGVS